MPVYLDCNATTPIEPDVRDVVMKYLDEEFGNAGSRTHDYGSRAKEAVAEARKQVSEVVDCTKEDVVFTSGATESNNLAILGLREHAEETGKKHIISTQIEHKAVLEPLEELEAEGFEVELLPPNEGGWVEPERLDDALRDDTLLVTSMQVNNETGIRQPIGEYAEVLEDHEAYFHVDAAQGFGKEIEQLRNERIDLTSISAHKIYAPKGIGALVVRRRRFERAPIEPLTVGGGQERGYRPGTLPVQLIAGFGKGAELALEDHEERAEANREFRQEALEVLEPLDPVVNGDQERCLPNTLNLAFPGIDTETVILLVQDHIAISNGSACTSSEDYEWSHVLRAMDLPEEVQRGAVRMSWCHMTETPDWEGVVGALEGMV